MSRIDDIANRMNAVKVQIANDQPFTDEPTWADVQHLLSALTASGADGARRLTVPELNHLLGLLEAEKESGEYAGPREQYYARTERLITWCQEQLNG